MRFISSIHQAVTDFQKNEKAVKSDLPNILIPNNFVFIVGSACTFKTASRTSKRGDLAD